MDPTRAAAAAAPTAAAAHATFGVMMGPHGTVVATRPMIDSMARPKTDRCRP